MDFQYGLAAVCPQRPEPRASCFENKEGTAKDKWTHRRETKLFGVRPSSTAFTHVIKHNIQVDFPRRLINILPLWFFLIKIPLNLLSSQACSVL